MELTRAQVLELMVSILGGDVDEATGWTSTGPENGRNVLQTTERVATRVLNDFNQRILNALSTVDGFKSRFDEVVGKNYTDDAEAFDAIGSNLIVAINDIRDAIQTLSDDQLIALAAKVDNSRVLTDVPENAVFTDTVYVHPTGDGFEHLPTGGVLGDLLMVMPEIMDPEDENFDPMAPALPRWTSLEIIISQVFQQYLQSFATDILNEVGARTVIISDQYLNVDNWYESSEFEGMYECEIQHGRGNGFKTIADIYIAMPHLDIASDAGVKSANYTTNGSTYIFADSIPESEIRFDMKLTISNVVESPPIG